MEIKYFYLPGCPYCQLADQLLTKLQNEHPEYKALNIIRLQAETEAANGYDFYYSPSFFLGKAKIYEAQPGDDASIMEPKILEVLQQASS